MALKSILSATVKDKLVLVRIDINSPIVNGKVLNNPRFKEAAKTLRFLLKKKARVVILAHQGRKGDRDYKSLYQHSHILSTHLKQKVNYIDALFEPLALKKISNLKPGHALLLRNVRDYDSELNPEKDKHYKDFCKSFDLFVNDAFSVSHRSQASIVLPPKYLESYIGLSFEKEIQALENISFNKKTMYLIGGSKIEDYFPLFDNLKNSESKILASGILANLLLVAKGIYLGYENEYLKDHSFLELIPKLRELYHKYKNQIVLPVDFAYDINGKREEKDISDLPVNSKILDIGKHSVELFRSHLNQTNNIFMKGPLGYSEMPKFSYATVEILKSVSHLSQKGSFSILSGGHLTSTLKKYKIKDHFSHVSLAGGALIAYISGKKLPGIEAIEKSNNNLN